MRAVLQRVLSASVAVQGEMVSEMDAGLLVLLGVGHEDSDPDVRWMADKIAHLRVFEDEAGKMNRSILEHSKTLIVVSQFTLYGDTRQGRRPSFTKACEPGRAQELYQAVVTALRSMNLKVGTGVFRAEMQVSLVNDGPVTLIVESPKVVVAQA